MLEDTADISRRTGCMEEYIKKGIAMACFYYARCLNLGRGIQQDDDEAKIFYSRVSKKIFMICLSAAEALWCQTVV